MQNKSLNEISKISEDRSSGIIVKANCKLCNSKFRSSAEELYSECRNISMVQRMLKNNGEDISVVGVRSHLQNHFIDVVKQEKVKDYVGELAKWKSIQVSKEERLKTYLSILEKRIFQLAAYLDDRDDAESYKHTDTLAKLVAQASSIQQQIDEMEQKIEPAKIVIKKLQEIIEISVKSSKSPELKSHLIDLVTDLQGNIGGLLGDG
jgi:flagellar biosynthesis chaperone FliJ